MAVTAPIVVWVVVAVSRTQRTTITADQYVETLARSGSLTWTISRRSWKLFLAHDHRCSAARSVVIGSSRLEEVDREVLGDAGEVCNLTVPAMDAYAFDRITRGLPEVTPPKSRVVYVGLDHFFFWADSIRDNWLDPLRVAPPLWKMATTVERVAHLGRPRITRLLTHYWRRAAAGGPLVDAPRTRFYPDGHAFHVWHYAAKAAGRVPGIPREQVSLAAESTIAGATLNAWNLERFEEGLRRLLEKRYEVAVFWNPTASGYLREARSIGLFHETIVRVDAIVRSVGVDRYVPAEETLDASRFGCRDADYVDTIHLDIDCLNRFFSWFLDHPQWRGPAALSETVFLRQAQVGEVVSRPAVR